MKHIKKYKVFENVNLESFDIIKDYIDEFCDTLDIDLYINGDQNDIYLKTNLNGIFACRFLNSSYEKTDEVNRYHIFVIEIRIKDSFRTPNEDKIKDMLNWIIERIDESEIKINNLELKFHSNQIFTYKSKKPILDKTFTKYDITFDIVKR